MLENNNIKVADLIIDWIKDNVEKKHKKHNRHTRH